MICLDTGMLQNLTFPRQGEEADRIVRIFPLA